MDVIWQIVISGVIIGVLILALDGEKKKRQIICPNPNCGYRGEGKVDGSKSGCLFLLLLMLGVLPGILYLLFAGKQGLICPKCGMRVR